MSVQHIPPTRIRRPHRVTILAFATLVVAAWNGIRLSEAIFFWKTLREYEARPGPLYIAISGGVWLVAGLILTGGLWLGKTWAWFATIGSAVVFPAWVWFDRLIFQQSHANWLFTLAVTLVCLFIISFFLFTRKTTSYFTAQRKSDEPQ